MVRYLLDSGAEVNAYRIYEPHTPLGKAIDSGKLEIVGYLIDRGASTTCQIYGEDIFEYCSLQSREMYRLLLKKLDHSSSRVTVGDIIHEAQKGPRALSTYLKRHCESVSQHQLEKALYESINYSKYRAMKSLLESGVDASGTTLDEPPLMVASLRYGGRALEDCQLLIDAGADVNVPGLLTRVVEEGDFEVLSLLVNNGADIEIFGPEALERAIKEEIEAVALLLDEGTPINDVGIVLNGLQAAAESGNIELAQYLIERGADVNAPAGAEAGRTALQAACEGGNAEMVMFLLGKKADVNAPPASVDGITAIDAAITRIDEKIFRLLLDHGAQLYRRDRPTNILHKLIKMDKTNLVRLVLETGIDANQMSAGKEGRTPLQLAAERGNLEIAKVLIDHRVEVNARPAY